MSISKYARDPDELEVGDLIAWELTVSDGELLETPEIWLREAARDVVLGFVNFPSKTELSMTNRTLYLTYQPGEGRSNFSYYTLGDFRRQRIVILSRMTDEG